MVETTKQQVLRKAADLVGRDQLAVLLKVPLTTLDAWLDGQSTMPDRKLRMLGEVLDDMSGPKQ